MIRDAKRRKWNLRFRHWQQGWTWNAECKTANVGTGSALNEFFPTRELALADAIKTILSRDVVAESQTFLARLRKRGTECRLTAEDLEAIERAGRIGGA
jgi:hypothetical protein